MYPYGPRPPRFPVQMPYQQRPMGFNSPFMPMRTPMQGPISQPRGLGGLFSKLFSKGNGATNLQGMGFPTGRGMFGPGIPPGLGRAASSQGAAGLSNMMSNFSSGGISGMLNNVQRVMGLAQQVGPMIQQYGPLIKNMPAMFKIMRSLNNTNSNSDTESTDENNSPTEEAEKENEKGLPIGEDIEDDLDEIDDDLDEIDNNFNDYNIIKTSKPKLYI